MSRKQQILTICWKLGLFKLTRKFYRKKLLILCYHGFAASDEAEFRPKLFIHPDVFRERMALLKKHGFVVDNLDSSLQKMTKETLKDNTIAITIDDGFYNILPLADPVFEEFDLPYTIYLTSYYAKKASPIYRLVIQYMFWKSKKTTVDFSSLEFLTDSNALQINLGSEDADKLCWECINYGETQLSESKRCKLSKQIGALLDVDYQKIVDSKSMTLLTIDECKELTSDRVDFQLHTHRHNLPDNEDKIQSEIERNREVISEIHNKPTLHFCYPSGLWKESQWPALEKAKVKSATTCTPGLNDKNTPLLGLYRFLDGENISEIEFIAEIYGFSHFLRVLRKSLNGLR